MSSIIALPSAILTGSVRWLFLIILFLLLITRKNLFRFFNAPLALLLFISIGWCLFTSIWSSIPELSLMKGALYAIMVPILILAGIEWTKSFPWEKSLDYLWMLASLVLLSALSRHQYVASNQFGFVVASSFPFFLWMTYRKWMKKTERLLWLFFTVCLFSLIFLSFARTSILIVLSILLCFFLNLRMSRKVTIFLCGSIILMGFILFNSSLVIAKINYYVYKRGNATVLQSRQSTWQRSYDGATEGGWTGLGFGVSLNYETFDLAKGFSTYGREKGNSQLAIIEETGLIGLFLYFVLVSYLLSRFIILNLKARDRDLKVLVAILTGIFLGLIAGSIFEGWWYAPFAPETIYFWLMIGVTRGLEIQIRNSYV